MKQTFKWVSFACLAIILAFTSCTQAEIEGTQDIPGDSGEKSVIRATMPAEPETRIAFDESTDGTKKVHLTWESGDKIVAYKNGGDYGYVATFTTTDSGSSVASFTTSEDYDPKGNYFFIYTTLDKVEADYDAMRNAIKNVTTIQSTNNDPKHLKHTIILEADYKGEGDILFNHTQAMMTVIIDKPTYIDGQPKSLTVKNGTSEHTVLFGENVSWENNQITTYLTVDTCDDSTRDLTFNVNIAGRICTKSFSTSLKYEKGVRYTAKLIGNNQVVIRDGLYLRNVPQDFIDAGTTWVILDDFSHSKAEFVNVRTALNSLSSTGEEISIVFPYLTSLPAEALMGEGDYAQNIVSIDMPNVTVIGERAFQICHSMAVVNLPSAIEIGESAFYDCWFTSINLPLVETIANDAFKNCKKLESINLSSVKTIGANAFEECGFKSIELPLVETIGASAFLRSSLVSLEMPSVKTIGANAFQGTKIVNLSLPSVEVIEREAFNTCESLKNICLPSILKLEDRSFSNNNPLNFENIELGTNHNIEILFGNNVFETWNPFSNADLILNQKEYSRVETVENLTYKWNGFAFKSISFK